MIPDEISLNEATTDQIIDELAKRSDALVFARTASLTAGTEEFLSYYRGGLTAGIGLCERLKSRLIGLAMQ